MGASLSNRLVMFAWPTFSVKTVDGVCGKRKAHIWLGAVLRHSHPCHPSPHLTLRRRPQTTPSPPQLRQSAGFSQPLSVGLAGVIVCGPSSIELGGADARRLLRPALVDGSQAPVGTSARRSNRCATNDCEHGI